MHILANGAGRNLRSTIINHLKIELWKRILKTYLICSQTKNLQLYVGEETKTGTTQNCHTKIIWATIGRSFLRKKSKKLFFSLKSPYTCREQ